MSAQPSLADEGCTLVVGTVDLVTITVSIEVVFRPGYPAAVDRRRIRRSDGSTAGVLRLHVETFGAMWRTLDACATGRRFDESVPIRGGAIRFVVRERATLEIAVINDDGTMRGGASILRGREVPMLAEALRLARHDER